MPPTMPERMSEDQCSICLEPMLLQQQVLHSSSSCTNDNDASAGNVHVPSPEGRIHRNPCGHCVHAHCLNSSIRAGNYCCPICRRPFRSGGSDGNGVGGSGIDGEGDDADRKPLKRYTRMLQVARLPEAAVKQRMVVDGVPPRMIDAFFTGGMSREVAAAGGGDGDDDDGRSSLALGEVAERKYKKMVEIGIPEEAVRNKMSLAGCSADYIDSFFASFYGGLKREEEAGR